MKRKKTIRYSDDRALSIVVRFAPQVESVRDAKNNVDVHVTSADAKNVGRRNHGECAMAVACKRELGADAMIVSASRVYVVHGKVATRFIVPPSVSREIVAFDRGAKFEPGVYRLNAPSRMARLGAGYVGSKTKVGKRARPIITHGIRASLAGLERRK